MDIADTSPADLLPVRMLNEYAYCPRLFHFMHVEGRWADNEYTIEGKTAHRRVDQIDHVLPDAERGNGKAEDEAKKPSLFPPDADEPPAISRSVPLGSDAIGITAKLDLVSSTDTEAVPVETKRGRVPNNPERSYEPERVQLMAQGLLLREAGFACDHGVLYFAASKTRVDIPFTQELESRTRQLITEARRAMSLTVLPEPLEDSPKCKGCSLNAICLPDETLSLRETPTMIDEGEEIPRDGNPPRRLYPVRDDATPFYVQEPGARIGTSRGTIVVTKEQTKLATQRLQDTSQLVLCGNIGITAQAIQILADAGVPVVHLSGGHWFYAVTHGFGLKNAFDRAAQFDAARDPAKCLAFAKQLVRDKGMNQRTLLRRNASRSEGDGATNGSGDRSLDRALADIDEYVRQVDTINSIQSLLGIEGTIAASYFSQFSKLLRPRDFDAQWDFTKRNRRPPADPVNAMLSFGYAMLAKECTVALMSEGLDPFWGFYHTPRHGRPALALDLMEPLRPTIVDSAVITAINTGMVVKSDFKIGGGACVMEAGARKAFIRAYEARLDQLITHPAFDYKCSWRVVIRLQARLLSRWLRGDIPHFNTITTR